MSQALAVNSKPIALELHQLLRDIDPVRWRDGIEIRLRDRIATIASAVARILGSSSHVDALEPAPLIERLQQLDHLLRDRVPEADLSTAEAPSAWANYRKQLGQAYESLSASLKAWSIQLPSLRPTNHTRSLVHVLTGIICLFLLEVVLSPRMRAIVPVVFATTFWGLEIWRRFSDRANDVLMWIFKKIAHPHEAHHVNSSTWYGTALAILGLTCPLVCCSIAVVVLGFADPAAAYVGRRYGKTKLVNGRSLEGSLTFAAVGTLVAFATIVIFHAQLGWSAALIIAASAAAPAAAAELFSRRVDDNMSVPLAAAAGGWIALQLLGLAG